MNWLTDRLPRCDGNGGGRHPEGLFRRAVNPTPRCTTLNDTSRACVLHFVQVLWARYPFDLINKISGRVGRAAAEHDELLKAFIARYSAGAMLATRSHIESGWLELQRAMAAAEPGAAPAVIPSSHSVETSRA